MHLSSSIPLRDGVPAFVSLVVAAFKGTVDGVTRMVDEWAALTGVKASIIRHRIAQGWPHDQAVSLPPAGKGKKTYAKKHAAKR